MAVVEYLAALGVAMLAAGITGSVAFLIESAMRDAARRRDQENSAEVHRLLLSFLASPFRDPLVLRRLALAPQRMVQEQLLDLAHTISPVKDRRLVRLLHRLGITESVTAALTARSWRIRLEAARSVNRWGLDAPAMGPLLDDPMSEIREQAILWTGRFGTGHDLRRVFEHALAGNNVHVALSVLAERRDDVIPWMPSLTTPDSVTPIALRIAQGCRYVPTGLYRLMEHDDPAVPEALVACLGQPEADALFSLARHGQASVRRRAIDRLADLGLDVQGLLDDPDWRVGRSAALAMMRRGQTCPVPTMVSATAIERYRHAQRWMEAWT